jgi:hypothetical protein
MNWKSRFFLAFLTSQSLLATFLTAVPAQGQTLTPPHDVSYATGPQRNTPRANEPIELEFTAPSYRDDRDEVADNGFRFPDELLFNDEIGARAIDLFGCDCASCRYTVSKMMEKNMYNVQSSQNKWQAGQFQAVRQSTCLRA